jgi:hypothetical protein
MKVFVYFNLHKKVWSVKALSGPNKGRVVAHLDRLVLDDCAFKVSEAGRQRVLREKRKNVHAGVVGTLSGQLADFAGVAVTYNPYKYSSFVTRNDEQPIHSAHRVVLNGRSVSAVPCATH